MKRTWISEHGEDYAVPVCITDALVDLGWHNDACPCFIRHDDPCLIDGVAQDIPTLALWVEHPDAVRRDSGSTYRFLVARNHEHPDVPEMLFETDDADQAVNFILLAKV